jgi:DNA-binding MarR family transcriptional regulator
MTNSLQLTQTIRLGMDLITHRAFREQARFVKASGLTMAQFGILMQLHYRQRCGISDISNHMDITSAAASQLVEKLVQGELLARTEDPADRRAKLLKLTPKGQELIEGGLAARHRWVDAFVEQLEPADRERVSEVLAIMTGTLRQMQEQEKTAESASHHA